MDYIYSLPTSVSFTGKGLLGYAFGPLKQKDLAISYVEVDKGNDTFVISNNITRHFYVLSGTGCFTIHDHKYPVSPGMLVEIPPKVEYCYSGKMKLLLFEKGRWFPGNDTHTKWNAEVMQGDFPCTVDDVSWLTRLVRLRIFGKSPISAFLWHNRRLWNALPASVTALRPIRLYGDFLHTLVRVEGVRGQLFHTYFLRNRAALDLIGRLVQQSSVDTLRVAVLGCSTGAEAYSVAWRIRSARPDLKLIFQAVDVSPQAVEVARGGAYSLVAPQFAIKDIFDGVTEAEVEELFDRDGDLVTVKSWIKEGIEWYVGDVGGAEILATLGPQDLVVANNFLCHMDDVAAERCLRNIARLVRPHGHLFVAGIDLDIRTKVARELAWKPMKELLEEMHEGDPHMTCEWPWHYSALEPFNKKRKDWQLRYASAFQLNASGDSVENLEHSPSQRLRRDFLLPENELTVSATTNSKPT